MNKRFAAGLLWTALAFAATPASATVFNFVHDGFSEGATISGSFVAEDLDGNGSVVGLGGGFALGGGGSEISDFELSFSGNSLVGAFTFDYLNLFVLGYTTDGGVLGDDAVSGEGLVAFDFPNNLVYQAGLTLVGTCGSAPVCFAITDSLGNVLDATSNAVQVTQVPSPSTPALALLPLLALGMGLRRRRDRSDVGLKTAPARRPIRRIEM